MENRIAPATFVVTKSTDAGTGSLRQAILDANATPGADTITFGSLPFAIPTVITLTTGPILISDWTDIFGPEAQLTIDGGKASRIFDLTAPINQPVSISDINLVNGYAATEGGGAIINHGVFLQLTNVQISNCTAVGSGGAISGGNNLATGCTFHNNTASGPSGRGGAISGNTLTFTNCTIRDNVATTGGGAADATKILMTDCTISGNTSATGAGGIDVVSSVRLAGSTFSHNSGSHGGAIKTSTSSSAPGTVKNCTLAFNTATTSGGGISIGAGPLALTSTLVANNAAPVSPDVAGKITANYCLISDSAGASITGSNNVLNVNPQLLPLADNGGPTLTHAVPRTSPAINVGSNPNSLANDQRGIGFPRVSGGAVDIGAFEFQFAPTVQVSVNGGATQRSVVKTINVLFTEPVAFPSGVAAAFALQRTGPGAPTGSVNLHAEQLGNSVTITFVPGGSVTPEAGGGLPDGLYQFTVIADKVNGAGGTLDGNNDGTAGDDHLFSFHRLFGDSDGDRDVDVSDFAAFRTAFGGSSTTFDFDNDGDVDAGDFGQFRARFGTVI